MSHASGTGLAGWKEFLKVELSQMISQAKGKSLSRDFFELVKNIGEAKSKQEEDFLMRTESKKLQEELKKPVASKKKEYLIRMMYCEIFGFSTEFGYIHAVNLTQSKDTVEKRVGYLACNAFLHRDHQFLMLVVNSVQKDLGGDNILEVGAALTTICRLINKEFIPAVESLVIKLLGHENPMVRKKAVMAFHRFVLLDPTMLARYEDKLRNSLCDANPSVMSATVNVFEEGARLNPKEHKDLIPSFVSILKQIVEGRLPKEYNYHRIPAPWIQVKILRVLALLGKNDKKASEHMYTSLFDAMKRADTGINAGFAIVFEAVKTISQIYPNHSLLDAAATSVSRFLTSNNHNLKYLGITALGMIVAVNPRYASEHRMTVVECLDDPDETLKRKTLDLLYSMTNPKNVVFIVGKLIKSLRGTNDNYLREELVQRITTLAERYSPDNEWFIKTLNTVFLISGELVRPETAHNLMQLIALGTGDDEDANNDLRRYAVAAYLKLADYRVLRDTLVQVIAWVLGEYGYLAGRSKLETIIEKLTGLVERQYKKPETRGFIVTALLKLCSQVSSGYYPPNVAEVVEKYKNSTSVDLQQRCYEFASLVTNASQLMPELLPADAFDEDLEVDINMRFLDGFVAQAVAAGGKRYAPPNSAERTFKPVVLEETKALNFEQYEAPKQHAVGNIMSPDQFSQPIPETKKRSTKDEGGLFGVRKNDLWSEQGYKPEIELAAAQAAMPKVETPTYSEKKSKRTSTRSQVSKKVISAEDEMLNEREKAAQELMMGFEGGSPKKSKKKKKKKKKKHRKGESARSEPIPHPQPGGSGDLLGLGAGSGGAAPPPVAAAVATATGGNLLFAGPTSTPPPTSGGAAPPADAAVAAPSTSSAVGGGGSLLGGMFDGMSSSTSAPTPAAALAAPATTTTTTGGDLLGGLFGSSGGAGGGVALAPTVQGNFPQWTSVGLDALQNLPLPATVNTDVAGSNSGPVTILTQDDNVHFALRKVFRPDDTTVLLFVSNKTGAALSELQLSFKVPDAFLPEFVADSGIEPSTDGFSIGKLPGQSTAVCRIKLKWRKHNVTMAIPSQVRYQDASGPRGSTLTLPLAVCDVLRPHVVNQQQFDAAYQQHTQERKGNIQFDGDIGAMALPAFNAHVVTSAPTQVTMAAKLVGQEKLALFKFSMDLSTSFELRTNDKFFADVLSRYVLQVFKK